MHRPIVTQLNKTKFYDLYVRLLTGGDLEEKDFVKVLAMAIFFLRHENENIQKLGYRLILLYTDRTKDYHPLFDVSINLGLIPITAAINRLNIESNIISESFLSEMTSAYMENYKRDTQYYTNEQVELNEFCDDNRDRSLSIVAPTSYGKSGLILSFLRNAQGNICILVPTKSLLAQTKRRIISAKINNIHKVITHPEMYSEGDINLVAVLTQERLLRLLQKNPKLNFDYIFVDEAHNLLEGDERNILLASSILVLKKRNPNFVLKFLTPFLSEPNKLQLRHVSYDLMNFKVSEYVKSEKIFLIDLLSDSRLQIYDQFVNKFFDVRQNNQYSSVSDAITRHSSQKNIIYFNRPKSLEIFSRAFCSELPLVKSKKINLAIEELSSYIHKDYDLIDCMKHGILYHHGSVPENVRLYIETLYANNAELKYMVTTSTLLEGVNLPADRMFLLDPRKGTGYLSQQQFRNLIGRICRFNDIFTTHSPDLTRLSPEIYVIKSEYMSAKANIEKFLADKMYLEKDVEEESENVLLASTQINPKNNERESRAEEYIENFERGTIPDYKNRTVTTEVGQCCFDNNLTELEILEHEGEMQLQVNKLKLHKLGYINNSNELFKYLAFLFIPYLRSSKEGDNIRRFEYAPTQKFYSMLLDWRLENLPYSQMIARTLTYWDRVIQEGRETLVYVGKWGDITREGHTPLWTDIKTRSNKEKVNLAVVRIKEELDFLDNILIKYIETINELGFIEEDYYSKVKYGTSDPRKIAFIKAGFSLYIANLLVDKYAKFVAIDEESGVINAKSNLLKEMAANHESEILRLEVSYNLGLEY